MAKARAHCSWKHNADAAYWHLSDPLPETVTEGRSDPTWKMG